MTRALTAAGTGQGAANPATAINAITGWLDASMVYGSDKATAASLRLPDGHMRTSANEYLPVVDGAYAAGDVRAGENSSLTALQTLFVREHNYQVERLHRANPELTGNALYNQAKAIVAAEIQQITYDEFLPHIRLARNHPLQGIQRERGSPHHGRIRWRRLSVWTFDGVGRDGTIGRIRSGPRSH